MRLEIPANDAGFKIFTVNTYNEGQGDGLARLERMITTWLENEARGTRIISKDVLMVQNNVTVMIWTERRR